jgi:hypothetical protein
MSWSEKEVGELKGRIDSLQCEEHRKDINALFEHSRSNRILIERLLTWARFIGVMLLIAVPPLLVEGVNIVKDWIKPQVARAENSR